MGCKEKGCTNDVEIGEEYCQYHLNEKNKKGKAITKIILGVTGATGAIAGIVTGIIKNHNSKKIN